MGILSSSSNLLILFLGLEGLTFAFYFLVAIDRERPQSGEAGLKYLLLGAVAAAFTAFGIALIYAGAGSLEVVPVMKALSHGGKGNPLAARRGGLSPGRDRLQDFAGTGPSLDPGRLRRGAGTGGGLSVHRLQGSGGGVSAPSPPGSGGRGGLRAPLWGLSLLSMVVGNVAALLQKNLKRMLAYSAIAQMGYVTLALLSGAGGGYGAAAFYLVAYTAMNLAAFGAVASLTGEDGTGDREDYHGLGYSRPFRGGVLALAMFALAGIPPTAGFIGKFFIFCRRLEGGRGRTGGDRHPHRGCLRLLLPAGGGQSLHAGADTRKPQRGEGPSRKSSPWPPPRSLSWSWGYSPALSWNWSSRCSHDSWT